MKKLLLLLSILLVANTFTSCKKEKEEEPEPTKTELLTAHEWKGVDAVGYVNGVQDGNPIDISDFTMLFGVNHHLFFYNDGDLSDDYAIWTLIEGDPDTIQLSEPNNNPQALYHLNLSQSNKSINDVDYTLLKIEKLTEDKFTFYVEGTNNAGDPVKIVYHMTK